MKKKLKVLFVLLCVLAFLFGVNWVYQVIRNPQVLISVFASGDFKSSKSTWSAYHKLFKKHSTDIMTPEFLAALAQVESAGNPLITPKWRWRLTINPTKIFAPASTSFGLYQYTKPTFKDAKRFCIHGHKPVLKGPIFDPTSCWFNAFYLRSWPSHSIEMTSARLHHYTLRFLEKAGFEKTSMRQKHMVAAVIHLCGVRKGEKFAKRGFNYDAISPCGTHSPRQYFKKIEKYQARFKRY